MLLAVGARSAARALLTLFDLRAGLLAHLYTNDNIVSKEAPNVF